MYLAALSNAEKELFLELAYDLATVDGVYSDEEKEVVAGYCQEMKIPYIQERDARPVEVLVQEFNKISGLKVKKIIVFESIGLGMADGNFDDDERALVGKLEKGFKLKPDFAAKCEAVLNEYILFQNKINQLILG